MIPETISKSGDFVLSFLELFEFWVLSDVWSMFAVLFPALFCVSSTADSILFPVAGSTAVPDSFVLPVIAKEENAAVWAVKYR